jgi:hypothetical protein
VVAASHYSKLNKKSSSDFVEKKIAWSAKTIAFKIMSDNCHSRYLWHVFSRILIVLLVGHCACNSSKNYLIN